MPGQRNSPNGLDALVWGAAELFPFDVKPDPNAGYRKLAAKTETSPTTPSLGPLVAPGDRGMMKIARPLPANDNSTALLAA